MVLFVRITRPPSRSTRRGASGSKRRAGALGGLSNSQTSPRGGERDLSCLVRGAVHGAEVQHRGSRDHVGPAKRLAPSAAWVGADVFDHQMAARVRHDAEARTPMAPRKTGLSSRVDRKPVLVFGACR